MTVMLKKIESCKWMNDLSHSLISAFRAWLVRRESKLHSLKLVNVCRKVIWLELLVRTRVAFVSTYWVHYWFTLRTYWRVLVKWSRKIYDQAVFMVLTSRNRITQCIILYTRHELWSVYSTSVSSSFQSGAVTPCPYLFIYVLFNDAVSISDYTALKNKMICENILK
jgi:hypothetical protein